MKRLNLIGTTGTGGTATIKGTRTIRGKLLSVKWYQGTLASTTDAVLSTINSLAANTNLLTLTNASADAMYYPRVAMDAIDGSPETPIDQVQIIDGLPQLALAQGGNTLTGGMILYYDED